MLVQEREKHISLLPRTSQSIQANLELAELLARRGITTSLNLQDIETDSLAQGTAFTNSDNITSLDANESGGAVSSKVLVSLLVTVVLLDVVQVLATDDDGAFHLGADNGTSKNTATNGDISSEGALLVNVSTSDGFLGSNEAQTDVLVPTSTLALGDNALVVGENGVLLLERLVMLLE